MFSKSLVSLRPASYLIVQFSLINLLWTLKVFAWILWAKQCFSWNQLRKLKLWKKKNVMFMKYKFTVKLQIYWWIQAYWWIQRSYKIVSPGVTKYKIYLCGLISPPDIGQKFVGCRIQFWSERRCADVVTIVLGIFFLLLSFSGRCFSTRKKAARVLNFCMGS